ATPWAWGYNGSGQLGNGTSTSYSAMPLQVSGLGGVTAIAAGASHSLAVKSDGTAWGWGLNFYGQLGNGTTGNGTHNATAVQVTGLREAAASAGGDGQGLAVKSD